MVQASKSRKSDDQRGPTGSSQMGGGEAMEVLRSLPPEAIMEILGDCYWGSLDGYALYIWNRISVEHKRKILESSKLLSAYVVALGNVPERDLAAHGDPAYLKDLKLAHLSNDAIAELVRKKSVPLAVLPKLRVESLPLTVAEWLDLNSDKTPATDARPDFAAIPASQGRALRVLRQFTKVTPDDEEAITGMKGVDVEVIQSVRSLAWIVSIEGEPLTELLKGFTAQELAEALDAPKSAIEHTLKHLPDKKRQLTMDYMKQGIASKQSDAFNDLFTAVLQAMRQNATAESASNDDETQEQEQDNVNAA